MDSAAVIGWSLLVLIVLLGLALIPVARRGLRRTGTTEVQAPPKTAPSAATKAPPKPPPAKTAPAKTAPPKTAPPKAAPPKAPPPKAAPPAPPAPEAVPPKAAPTPVVPRPSVPEAEEVEAPEVEAPPEVEEAPAVQPVEEVEAVEAPPELEKPAPTAGRLVRLRARLSRSQNAFGKGLLALISRDRLDEDTWEEIEETLITADVGLEPTRMIVERLREQARVLGTGSATELRGILRDELVGALDADADRALKTTASDGTPAVILVVGVNGSGKTTTCGKIARVIVADGHSVVLGAADTFRAAAADQLATWAGRVGAEVVRGPEAGDPAAVAFDAVRRGIESGVDTVLIDTAGRL